MTIGGLFCGFDPSWKVRDIMIVGDKCELQSVFCLQAEQQGPCVGNSEINIDEAVQRLAEARADNSDGEINYNGQGCLPRRRLAQ
jgi:hypothetical protein